MTDLEAVLTELEVLDSDNPMGPFEWIARTSKLLPFLRAKLRAAVGMEKALGEAIECTSGGTDSQLVEQWEVALAAWWKAGEVI